MDQRFPPLGTFFLIFLATLFVVLIVAWGCRACIRVKPRERRDYTRDYSILPPNIIRAVDVQTGQTVLIQGATIARTSSNPSLGQQSSGRPWASGTGCTVYGTIMCEPQVVIPCGLNRYLQPTNQPQAEELSRSPPPPYSEVYQNSRS